MAKLDPDIRRTWLSLDRALTLPCTEQCLRAAPMP
jgi:hypothetical protein